MDNAASFDGQVGVTQDTRPGSSEVEIERTFWDNPQRTLDVGHSKLAYYAIGRGPDLLLVHGWPLHSATFRHILPALARHFRCHLIDLPGAGRTITTVGPHIEMRAHARTLREAVAQLGLERYQVLAHDSGAVVARLLAAEDPRIAGLVIGNSEIPGHRSKAVELYARLARLRADFVTKLTLAIGPLRRSPLAFGGCFSDPSYAEGEFHSLFIQPLLDSDLAPYNALLRYLDWSVIDGLAEVHAAIQAPVRLIWGTRDPFFPIQKARGMVGQFAGKAELVEIPGAKLLAHEDHPSRFSELASEFLLGQVRVEH